MTKRFGHTLAVDRLDLNVERGGLVGVVGPNGAGKTTTLRILSGFLAADAGRVEIANHDVAEEPVAARAQLGYLPESAPLYPEMRVAEYLRFRARLRQVPRSALGAVLEEAALAAGVVDQLRRIIGHLSKGYRQRVGLAAALLGRPPLLILDEPLAGLDPVQVRSLRDTLAALSERHTVLLSSHQLTEIERIAARVVVIAAGRLVGDGSAAALREQAGLAATADFEDVFISLAASSSGAGRAKGA